MGLISGLITGAASALFGKHEAAKQRSWQEKLSNTAIRRQVEDLKAAGLNPVLAANLGGASVPSGASTPSADFAGALASGASSARQRAEAKQVKVRADMDQEMLDWFKSQPKVIRESILGARAASQSGLPGTYGAAYGGASSAVSSASERNHLSHRLGRPATIEDLDVLKRGRQHIRDYGNRKER